MKITDLKKGVRYVVADSKDSVILTPNGMRTLAPGDGILVEGKQAIFFLEGFSRYGFPAVNYHSVRAEFEPDTEWYLKNLASALFQCEKAGVDCRSILWERLKKLEEKALR